MSDVFFTDVRAPVTDPSKWYQPELSAVSKFEKLVRETNLFDFIEKGDKVAVKIHFGLSGTTRVLRPVFVRKAVELIKDQGGRPFVTETTGLGLLYDKSHAIGRLMIAEENGFTQQTCQAPIIVADGLLGFDYTEREIDGKWIRKVHVARAIAEADKVVSLAHFKGHIRAGIGGAIKNIGVGCVAKPSKYSIHLSKPPEITEKCTKCGKCVDICPADAIDGYRIDLNKCLRCLGCYEVCEYNALNIGDWLMGDEIAERIVECAKGVLEEVGRENFVYVNFAIDITPHCDCHPYSDQPMAPDIGIFASRDIVSVDTACYDALKRIPEVEGSLAEKLEEKKFPWTSPERQLIYAENLGIGERGYRIIEI